MKSGRLRVPLMPACARQEVPGRVRRVPLLVVLLTVSGAWAESGPVVAAGAPELDTEALEAYSARWTLEMVKDGHRHRLGSMTESLEAIEVDGRPAFAHTRYTDDPLGSYHHRLVFLKQGLVPVHQEIVTGAGGSLALDFGEGRVSGEGSATALGDGERALEATLQVPVFDADMLGLVLRTLPLQDGYRARLPVFAAAADEEGATWLDIAVTCREPVQYGDERESSAWVVDVRGDDGLERTYWIIDQAPYVARLVSRYRGIQYLFLL